MVDRRQQSTEAVETFFRQFTVETWQQSAAMLLPTANWEVYPATVGSKRGVTEHMRYLRDVMADYDSFLITPRDLVASADGTVYCTARSDCQHKLLGAYGQDYTFLLRVNEAGQIAYVREFVDSLYSAKFFGKVEKMKRGKL